MKEELVKQLETMVGTRKRNHSPQMKRNLAFDEMGSENKQMEDRSISNPKKQKGKITGQAKTSPRKVAKGKQKGKKDDQPSVRVAFREDQDIVELEVKEMETEFLLREGSVSCNNNATIVTGSQKERKRKPNESNKEGSVMPKAVKKIKSR